MSIALLATAALAGCSSSGTSSEDDAPVTLHISTWAAESAGWKDWYPALADTFEDSHPGVTVEIQQIAYADYVSSLTTQFVAGEGPELVHVPLPLTTVAAWADAGFLEDLSDFVGTTDIGSAGTWSANQAAMEWDGKTYGVLMQDYGYMLFYNQALLDAAGVEVPTNVNELLDAAEATTKDGKFGFSVTGDNTANFLRDVLLFVNGEGAKWINNGSFNFTDPAVVKAVDDWRTLATDYAPQGTDVNTKRQAFFDGNVAMMIEGPFIYGQIASSSPADVAPNLHMAQLPFANPSGDLSNGIAVVSGLDDRTKELAEEFVKLTTSAEQLASLATAVTSPVARNAANAGLATNDDMQEVVDAHENMKGLIYPVDAVGLRQNFADFQQAATDALHTLLTSDTPTQQVLANLQDALESGGIKP